MSRLKEIRSYYDNRYGSGDLGMSMRSPESFQPFLDWIEVKQELSILDVGCGSGALLSNRSPNSDSWGIDLSEQAVRIAKSRVPEAQLCVGDMQCMPFRDGHFDKVLNIGGLEHVPDMTRALCEMKRVCQKDGRLCLVVPNKNFILYRLLPIEGTKQSRMEEHLLSIDGWKELIHSSGLEIIDIHPDPGPYIRTDIGLGALFRGIMRRALLFLINLISVEYTYQFVFICKA